MLTSELDQVRARQEAMLHIASQVAKWSDQEEIFHNIVSVARRLLDSDVVVITRVDLGRGHVRILAQEGLSDETVRAFTDAPHHFRHYTVGRQVYGEGEAIIMDDCSTRHPIFDTTDLAATNSLSACLIPLKQGDLVLGALSVFFKVRKHNWKDDEVEWLSALAEQAVAATVMRESIQSHQRDVAVREALHTASQRLQSAADLSTVIQATMEGVMQVVPSVGVAVHLLNESATEATIAGLAGFKHTSHETGRLVGFRYPANDSILNRRSLIEHEAFYLRDFQVEADKWQNSDAPTLRAWMSVPMMSRGRCFGKITVDHDLPDVYGPEEVAIVQTFAAHAASAIERAYLYAETTERADHLAALYQVSQELVAATDAPSLYSVLQRWAMKTFTAEVFFICLARTEGDRLEFQILIDEGVDYAPRVLGPQPGLADHILRTGKGLLLNTRDDWNRHTSRMIGNEGRKSTAAMFAPLVWSGLTLGVMSVQTYQDIAYSADEFQTFQALAATAALALGRLQSEEATAERAAQFAALAQSARALVSNLELSDVLQTVADRANELTGGEAFLMLYNTEEAVLKVRTFAGKSAWHEEIQTRATLRLNEGVGGTAFAEQRTIVVQEMLEDQRAQYRGISPMHSLVVLPLTVGDNRMGILELAWPEPRAVTPERLALCKAFADHAALAIHNAHQHDQLRHRESERTALLHQLLTAQEAERKRVAIDLHDGPLQSLGVGLINADTLRRRAEQGTVTAREIDALRLDFAAVVDEVRDLMADLRPEVLDAYGLLPALKAHARRIGETFSLPIEIESDLADRLPAYMEVLIYRLVQESLSNVRKHALATQARVTINVDEIRRMVCVSVADNGRGFNPKQVPTRTEGFGLGLGSMAERTASAGGMMTIDSSPGGPTTVRFQLPLPASSENVLEDLRRANTAAEW